MFFLHYSIKAFSKTLCPCFQAGSSQHLGKNKARFKSKYSRHGKYDFPQSRLRESRSEQLSVHPSYPLDSSTLNKSSRSGYKEAANGKIGSRDTIPKPTGGRAIRRLKSDLERLLRLLKSRKDSPQQDEENGMKKASSEQIVINEKEDCDNCDTSLCLSVYSPCRFYT